MNTEIDKEPKREIAAPRSNKMHMDLWIYPHYQTHGMDYKIVWHGFAAVWISLKKTRDIFTPTSLVSSWKGRNGSRQKRKTQHMKQVRPNDVWTCVACSYFIYKKLT